MFFPLGMILIAAASAFVVAYGTDPRWVQFSHGLGLILFSRRFQWPLVSLSLIACVGLLGLIVSGRRRAWWLIGLAPVLALFAHRFATGPEAGNMTAIENPEFVSANNAGFIKDEDYVVGLSFGNDFYAYPYAQLYSTPVVLQADHEKRMMLMWSAYANRAVAVNISRELHPRDLDVVSTPANALLLYNSRLGQFINGLKGLTTKGEKPTGFGAPIATAKMPWGQWRRSHNETKVLAPQRSLARFAIAAPTQPIKPTCPMPPMLLEHPADFSIAMIGATQPTAIASAAVGASPLNLKADQAPVFVVREEGSDSIHGFNRQIKPDLLPRFVRNTNPRKHPTAMFVDVDTNSGWDARGVWVDGLKDLKGKKLQPVMVDDGLYWGVMKYWYPELQLETVAAPEDQTLHEPDEAPATQPARRSRRSRTPRTRGTPNPAGQR